MASEQDKHGNPVKDSDSEDIDLIKIVVKPVLGIEKKVSNTTPKPGERITYTITVTNRGDGAAQGYQGNRYGSGGAWEYIDIPEGR